MLSKRFLVILPVLGLVGVLGAHAASAQGPFGFGRMGPGIIIPDQVATQHQTMFQNQADMLGLSIDDVKNAWADGKSIQQLMTEKGITKEQVQTRQKEAQLVALKAQLQTLVNKGIITQAQADRRLQTMQTASSKKGSKGMMGGMGMMRGGRRGFRF